MANTGTKSNYHIGHLWHLVGFPKFTILTVKISKRRRDEERKTLGSLPPVRAGFCSAGDVLVGVRKGWSNERRLKGVG